MYNVLYNKVQMKTWLTYTTNDKKCLLINNEECTYIIRYNIAIMKMNSTVITVTSSHSTCVN